MSQGPTTVPVGLPHLNTTLIVFSTLADLKSAQEVCVILSEAEQVPGFLMDVDLAIDRYLVCP